MALDTRHLVAGTLVGMAVIAISLPPREPTAAWWQPRPRLTGTPERRAAERVERQLARVHEDKILLAG